MPTPPRPLVAALFTLAASGPALGHFQELIPTTEVVASPAEATLDLQMTFTHPMARGPVMAMGEPVRVGVLTPTGPVDLKAALQPVSIDDKPAWSARYKLTAPGDHVFFVEPAPYWEPDEGVMIVHYTKTVVDGFGGGSGWDAMVGLPVEIEPLVRPYGLWTGNLFRGIVRRNGAPVPFAEVEVEWRNDGSVKPPADAFLTQVVKADGDGVFSYAMPRAGWWGFAALVEGDEPMPNPSGEPVPVEQGGLIWVRVRDFGGG